MDSSTQASGWKVVTVLAARIHTIETSTIWKWEKNCSSNDETAYHMTFIDCVWTETVSFTSTLSYSFDYFILYVTGCCGLSFKHYFTPQPVSSSSSSILCFIYFCDVSQKRVSTKEKEWTSRGLDHSQTTEHQQDFCLCHLLLINSTLKFKIVSELSKSRQHTTMGGRGFSDVWAEMMNKGDLLESYYVI